MLGHGGGSSFDGIVDDAKKLKVLKRWVDYIDHPLFKMVLNDREIRELSVRVFGKIKGLEYVHN